MTEITGYHAHIYFDADTVDLATRICQQAGELFTVTVGRVHQKNVGPHPRWSCQLAFSPDQFDRVIPWLLLNRAGLTVFAHPETGNELADHRDHAFWMGEKLGLDLTIFA